MGVYEAVAEVEAEAAPVKVEVGVEAGVKEEVSRGQGAVVALQLVRDTSPEVPRVHALGQGHRIGHAAVAYRRA